MRKGNRKKARRRKKRLEPIQREAQRQKEENEAKQKMINEIAKKKSYRYSNIR